MNDLSNNEKEILKAFPNKGRAVSFDKLPYCEGEREETVNQLLHKGLIKKDSYWDCWLTETGREIVKQLKLQE